MALILGNTQMFKKTKIPAALLAILLAESPGIVVAQDGPNPKLHIQPDEVPTLSQRPAVLPPPAELAPAAAQQAPAQSLEQALAQLQACGRNNGRWKQCLESRLLGYLSEFEARPVGAVIGMHFQAQVSQADYSRMMVRDYDFCIGGAELNARGKDLLIRKAACLTQGSVPFIVEYLPYAPALAEARRQVVLNFLGANGVNASPEMVVIGSPQGRPISGEEAILIHQNLLQQTQSAGTRPAAAGDTASGFAPTSGFTPGSFIGGGNTPR